MRFFVFALVSLFVAPLSAQLGPNPMNIPPSVELAPLASNPAVRFETTYYGEECGPYFRFRASRGATDPDRMAFVAMWASPNGTPHINLKYVNFDQLRDVKGVAGTKVPVAKFKTVGFEVRDMELMLSPEDLGKAPCLKNFKGWKVNRGN